MHGTQGGNVYTYTVATPQKIFANAEPFAPQKVWETADGTSSIHV
jgi:hypothetical protein